MGISGLSVTGSPAEAAEPEVAAGDDRAHAELFGEAQGSMVVRFGVVAITTIRVGGGLAKMQKGPGLYQPLASADRALERRPGELERRRHATDKAFACAKRGRTAINEAGRPAATLALALQGRRQRRLGSGERGRPLDHRR